MGASTSVTGIPTDMLIMAVAGLCSLFAAAAWKELRALRVESTVRGQHITALKVMLKQVCARLNIPYSDGE